MVDAVILAVQGVLVPRSSFQRAAVDAASLCLAEHGVPAPAFRRAALRRLATSGSGAFVSRTLADMHRQVPPALRRRAVLAARAGAPQHEFAAEVRHALRALRAHRVLGFFDGGRRETLDALLARLGCPPPPMLALWAESLGEQARPGRALPFRWLTRRLDIPASLCLFVATAGPERRAARRAGWHIWPPEPAPVDGPLDLWQLVDWLDAQAVGKPWT